MNSMLLTYIITLACALLLIGTVIQYQKTKKLSGKNIKTAIASLLVLIMGIIATIMNIPITSIQAIIEKMFS